MFIPIRAFSNGCVLVAAAAVFWLYGAQAQAQPGMVGGGGRGAPLNNPFNNPLNNPFNNPFGGGGLGGGGNQAVGIQRATSKLPNPLNFWQYGQTTSVGVIHGTVRIYNEFGTLAQGGSLTQGGGMGGGGTTGQLPGQGATQGDDPSAGVLLHVNYAAMYLPTQQQINAQAQNRNAYGGFGGFSGGYGGGYPAVYGGFGGGVAGKGVFGNGGNGL
jgi:hypothetical protein